ncbi:PAS domain S-box-containing protein [Algibacter lectus]|uniref:PAS domain-containing sensor histidine kinase n=1 Tax=Algibacter lectus TaxID=221126 RepID=UPI0008DFA720|nr:PAS domain-containing sensor histidine kinase [Algibacter lectus]SFC95118.1 PAS domain S-box-containing protein [Algibacter lectus]
MFSLDIRTLYLCCTLINILNIVLISSLHIQVKKRFPGTFLILINFCLGATGNVLVFFRGYIPDWASIPLANVLLISSLIGLLMGLEQFLDKKGSHIHNYILTSIFLIIHSYYTFIEPDLNARNINIAFAYVIISFQIIYLMFRRTPIAMRKITRSIGYLFCAVFIIQVLHIIYNVQKEDVVSDYFKSSTIESLFLSSWIIITVLMPYTITLMYNKRLIININKQEEKFSKAFHAAPFVITLSKFSDGKIFEVNKSVEAISDYKIEDIIGMNSAELNLWGQKSDRQKFLTSLSSNGFVKENEYIFRKKSGELFPGSMTAQVININNEDCIISVINDISNRKKAELNLRNSEATLRELNSTKDKFFSIIAHDLRTPFNGIMGFSQILRDQIKENNYEDIDEYAEIIYTSSEHAMALLSNLMEWSRSQSGQMKFNPEYIDLIALIQNTLGLLKTSSEQKQIHINLDAAANIIVYADKEMIETVLRNIISNAIKFTPKKGVINIQTKEMESEHLISVIDSGVGISKDDLEKLFHLDKSHTTAGTNDESGTGLGLILCKDFIDYHKGKIWAESEVGVGTNMRFCLPKINPLIN